MKKILILANNDVGLYKFRKNLIIELLKENIVYISLPYGEYIDELVALGCKFINTKVDRRAMNPITDLFLMLRYYSLLSSLKPDLVITYTIKPNIYGGFVSRIKKITYCANITGLGKVFQNNNSLRKVIIFMYMIALKYCKTVFFENSENLNIFVKNKIANLDNAVKLNGAGVDLIEYPQSEYPNIDQGIRFLFIGRIMKDKGIEEFLESARIIKRIYTNAYFDIVGPNEDDYEYKLQEFENQGIIKYHGSQKDVIPFIQSCHCFVLPSYHEGMANTLLESAAIGRPLIASDISGCREIIRENNNGFLVKPKDVFDLVNKLEQFIKLSYQEMLNMSVESRKIAECNFDKVTVVNETLKNIYKGWN